LSGCAALIRAIGPTTDSDHAIELLERSRWESLECPTVRPVFSPAFARGRV
jgi:hypothetical protein